MKVKKSILVFCLISFLILVGSLIFQSNENNNLRSELDKLHNELVTVDASLNLASVAYVNGCIKEKIKEVGKKNGALAYCNNHAKKYKKELFEIINQKVKVLTHK